MRCGHCGRKITAAALAMGYCPSCGNLLDEHEELKPMRMEIRVQPENASAHLPAAAQYAQLAPPEPYIPPPPYFAPAEESPARATTSRESTVIESPQLPPGPSGYSPYEAAQATPPTAPPPPSTTHAPAPRRGNPFVAIGIVLVVLLAAGGVMVVAGQNGLGPLSGYARLNGGVSVASPTQTTQPTSIPTATLAPTATPFPTATPLPAVPAPPAGYTTFKSSDGLFGLNYPSTWSSSPQPPANGVATFNFASASFAADQFVQVDVFTTLVDPTTIETYLTNYAANSNGNNIQITVHATSFAVGNNTWMRAEGTYTGNDGGHQVVALAINHGNSGFLFFYDARTPAFQDASGSSFDVMVKSFTFLQG